MAGPDAAHGDRAGHRRLVRGPDRWVRPERGGYRRPG